MAMVLWKVIMVPTWLWTGFSWNNHSEILNITLGVPLYYFGVKLKNFNFQQNHDLEPWFYERWLWFRLGYELAWAEITTQRY